jgi:hypothetical protein
MVISAFVVKKTLFNTVPLTRAITRKIEAR